jgi:hypothetical protein
MFTSGVTRPLLWAIPLAGMEAALLHERLDRLDSGR